MDLFSEYIVKKKKDGKDILKIAGIVIAAIILVLFSFALVAIPLLSSFAVLVTAGVVYGAYYLITNLNVEYEYIVTNGELDVDTILNRRKRKRIITVHSKTFELVAPVGSSEYKGEENGNFTRVIDASSGRDNAKAYFAIFSKDGQRIKLIFEPTQKMLDAFKTFVPRNVKE